MRHLEELFPGLSEADYRQTSDKDVRYNCIAWAADDSSRWWQPDLDPFDDYYWPRGVQKRLTLDAYIEAFATLGYKRCDVETYEDSYQRVALFIDEAGCPTHAARQLPTGRWTSKIGGLEDIEHDLSALEGEKYGKVAVFLKRPRKNSVG